MEVAVQQKTRTMDPFVQRETDEPRRRHGAVSPTGEGLCASNFAASDEELLSQLLYLNDHVLDEQGQSFLQQASKLMPTMQYEDFCVKGFTSGQSAQLVACVELGRRMFAKESLWVSNPRIVWDELRTLRAKKKEHLVVFYLNAQEQELHREIISIGTLTSLLIHPREVFEPAIRLSAFAILIAHNHPSGQCEPSREDTMLTERLEEVGRLLGIPLLDHVVVTTNTYFSFREQGILGHASARGSHIQSSSQETDDGCNVA